MCVVLVVLVWEVYVWRSCGDVEIYSIIGSGDREVAIAVAGLLTVNIYPLHVFALREFFRAPRNFNASV